MTQGTIAKLVEWIKARDNFAIVMHVSPDGDTTCSALMLSRALSLIGKRAEVVCQDDVPRMYAYLPNVGSVLKPDAARLPTEHVIFVDVSSTDRAGSAWQLMQSSKGSASIDHHETNPGFTDVCLIDGGAAATGELVALLLKALDIPLDVSMAVLLYTSLSTDTGNFSYSNTTPLSLRLTAECIEAGLKIDEINTLLFHRRTLPRTLLLGSSLNGIVLDEGGKVAFAEIRQSDFVRCRASHEDNEGIVSYLMEIEGVSVSALLEERGAQTKVSLRSNGEVNVGQIALALGGGGHERASGVQLELPISEARALIQATISNHLKGMY